MTLLELADVAVHFGGVRALDGVSIAVEAGRVTALIGPNGAGKTTLVNVIGGATRPDAGTVRLLGRDITGRRPHRISRLGMSRTFQHVELFGDMSVLENVLVGRHARMRAGAVAAALRLPRHRADEQAGRRAAGRLLERFGLADVASTPAADLPFGLQRRTELARALAAEPVLLLLDEPLAGLTDAEIEDVGRVLRELAGEGLGVLLVDHATDAVLALSDHVVVLDRGSVLAEGAPARIRAEPRVVTAYLGTAG